MEHLSIGKLFVKWFIGQAIYISLFLIFGAVFVITALQYRMNIEPVLYSLLICTFLGCCYLIYNFILYKSRYTALYETYVNIETTISTLPKPGNYIEELYSVLLHDLFDNRTDLYSKMKKQELESKDYYTIWIHQIKTPIAALYLLLQTEDGSKKNTMLMKQELFKIEQYAEMALYYLRLQHMSFDMLLKECNLYEIVKQSVKKHSIGFIEKKISLNLEAFDGIVISDEKWLGFVIEQILSNCIKYTTKGSITIDYIDANRNTDFNDKLKHAYGVTSSDSVLCISDTGIGIKEEDLPRIFEKGFTGYNGRMDKKSTGIGLYLCEQVLNKLGFDISVTSEAGKGTMFQIYFGNQNGKAKVGELD